MKVIDIIGDIGAEITKASILAQLKDSGDVTLNISSLGGNVDDALYIHDALKAHKGNVVANLGGFVASAATIIATGADKVIMSENAFYLIHKSLSGILVWAMMNEDDIDNLIKNLEEIKDVNQKIDAVIANIYSKKTGKRAKTMLNLMAEEKWLTAEEAQAWGLVDEISTPQKQDIKNTLKMVAEIKAHALPELPIINKNQTDMDILKAIKEVKDLLTKAPVNKEDKPEFNAEEITTKLSEIENKFSEVESEKNTEIEKLKNDQATEMADIKAKHDKEIADLNAELAKAKAGKVDTEGDQDPSATAGEVETSADQFGNAMKTLYKRARSH